MKITFYTLGCRLNQAETSNYKEVLAKKGFVVVDFKDNFDVAVINTCAVTHKADREGRQNIRKLKKRCPQAKIVMTGCSDFKLPEVDYYIKNKEKFVEEFLKVFPRINSGSKKIKEKNKTRINIKIQTGCDNYCTYCITTYRRGKSKSFSNKKIISQINEKVRQGFKEVVLTGVNIGQYKFKDFDLTNLISQILKQTKIARIRLSSINPDFVYNNKKFKNLFKNKRLCRHLHLSLQSGSDSILKKMNRNYNTKQYLKIIKNYYKNYPLFGFTTDIIVGFPSETNENFKETCEFVKKCKFLKIHIFRYSKRSGTAAAIMKDQVDEKVKKQRAKKLQEINLNLQKEFFKKIKNKKILVLFEAKKEGYWQGYAGNYFLVKKIDANNLENIIKLVKI